MSKQWHKIITDCVSFIGKKIIEFSLLEDLSPIEAEKIIMQYLNKLYLSK